MIISHMTDGLKKLLPVLLLSGCGGNNPTPSPPPPSSAWTCYHCVGMSLNSDGSFTFPNSSGAVGYIYKSVSGNPINKTMTLNYSVSGSGTVLPSPASGSGAAEVRLFLWRTNDNIACSAGNTEWYRWWSPPVGSGGGLLTVGQYTLSASIKASQWSDCLGHVDTSGSQFAATTANLLGAGFTFGAEFFGHGVYSTGSNSFKISSFTIQ